MRCSVARTDRRRFLRGGVALVGLGVLSGCGLLPPRVGPPTRVPRLGLLAPGSEQAYAARVAAIRTGLRNLGHVEGETFTVEYRFGEGANEAGLVDLARSLVEAPVDLIVTAGSACIRPAMMATTTIPIVMVADNADPVSVGYVASPMPS